MRLIVTYRVLDADFKEAEHKRDHGKFAKMAVAAAPAQAAPLSIAAHHAKTVALAHAASIKPDPGKYKHPTDVKHITKKLAEIDAALHLPDPQAALAAIKLNKYYSKVVAYHAMVTQGHAQHLAKIGKPPPPLLTPVAKPAPVPPKPVVAPQPASVAVPPPVPAMSWHQNEIMASLALQPGATISKFGVFEMMDNTGKVVSPNEIKTALEGLVAAGKLHTFKSVAGKDIYSTLPKQPVGSPVNIWKNPKDLSNKTGPTSQGSKNTAKLPHMLTDPAPDADGHKKLHQEIEAQDTKGPIKVRAQLDTSKIPPALRPPPPKPSESTLHAWGTAARNKMPDTARLALSSYQGSGYSYMNRQLAGLESISPHEQNRLDAIQEQCLANVVPSDYELMRGISATLKDVVGVDDPEQALGKAFLHKGFVSSSRASGFTGRTVTLKIKARAGQQGLVMPEHGNEREILLPHSSVFRITHVETTGTSHVVHCEYLGVKT